MDTKKLEIFIEHEWTHSILPTLEHYIRIPNQSVQFDPKWEQHGYMEQAVQLLSDWVHTQAIKDLNLTVQRLPGRTPLIFIDIPGQKSETILLYGHLDKQPEMTGWRAPLGPWTPIREGEKLYGRGGADDGYAIFASIAAIAALQAQGIPHGRCVIIIEACEESGSTDLPYYLKSLESHIGKPDLVICLDSGCGNYEQLWCTTSLRGLISGILKVSLLTEGIHSGNGSGIIASSFRVTRQLLSRLENESDGTILVEELHADIPPLRRQEATQAALVLNQQVVSEFPLQAGVQPVTTDYAELILNRTWRPALSIIGAEGIPAISAAGNVLRPYTAFKLSMRIPPTCDANTAIQAMQKALTVNPPYGAHVEFTPEQSSEGWNAQEFTGRLSQLVGEASSHFFKQPAAFMGEGGSIPFIAMLAKKFPEAQFLITGVLGPHSNAHGPNEFLHIPTAKRLTACVAYVVGGFA